MLSWSCHCSTLKKSLSSKLAGGGGIINKQQCSLSISCTSHSDQMTSFEKPRIAIWRKADKSFHSKTKNRLEKLHLLWVIVVASRNLQTAESDWLPYTIELPRTFHIKTHLRSSGSCCCCYSHDCFESYTERLLISWNFGNSSVIVSMVS